MTTYYMLDSFNDLDYNFYIKIPRRPLTIHKHDIYCFFNIPALLHWHLSQRDVRVGYLEADTYSYS